MTKMYAHYVGFVKVCWFDCRCSL